MPQGSHIPLLSTLQINGKESDARSRVWSKFPVSERDSTVGLSSELAVLFPAGAICAVLTGSGNPNDLLPEEAQYVQKAVASRREEFAAGRACAAQALSEIGVEDFPLRVGSDRRPVWPAGIIGSITHTEGFCAAVVARQRDYRAIGIDTEVSARVKPELWPRICGPEMGYLEGMSKSWRPVAATLIFCIKEAFYKCQYNLTGEYLGFDAARVEIQEGLSQKGEFAIFASNATVVSRLASVPLTGRYLFHEPFVTAGLAIPQ